MTARKPRTKPPRKRKPKPPPPKTDAARVEVILRALNRRAWDPEKAAKLSKLPVADICLVADSPTGQAARRQWTAVLKAKRYASGYKAERAISAFNTLKKKGKLSRDALERRMEELVLLGSGKESVGAFAQLAAVRGLNEPERIEVSITITAEFNALPVAVRREYLALHGPRAVEFWAQDRAEGGSSRGRTPDAAQDTDD